MNAREVFEKIRQGFAALDNLIPNGQYYRYNDHWRYATQRLCFLAALIVFLEKGILIDKETTAQILGGNKLSQFCFIFIYKNIQPFCHVLVFCYDVTEQLQ